MLGAGSDMWLEVGHQRYTPIKTYITMDLKKINNFTKMASVILDLIKMDKINKFASMSNRKIAAKITYADIADSISLLGLPENFSLQDLKSKHRELVLKFHPDILPESERNNATLALAKINNAVDVLNTAIKNGMYSINTNQTNTNQTNTEQKPYTTYPQYSVYVKKINDYGESEILSRNRFFDPVEAVRFLVNYVDSTEEHVYDDVKINLEGTRVLSYKYADSFFHLNKKDKLKYDPESQGVYRKALPSLLAAIEKIIPKDKIIED